MTTDHSTHEHDHAGGCLDGSGYSLGHERPEPGSFHDLASQGGLPPAHTPAHLAHLEAEAFGSGQIPEGRHMAPISALPPSDFLMSLTGFDEIAIAARFGMRLSELRRDAIEAGRALAFVHYRRAGQNDVDAHKSALTLTLREVSEFFTPEPATEDAEGNDSGA